MSDAIALAAQDLAQEMTGSDSALSYLRTIQVHDQASLDDVARMIQTVKARWNVLEKQRKDLTAPINESKRRADALFKPALEFYAQSEAILKAALGTYYTEQERQRLATIVASTVEYQQGGTPTEIIPAPVATAGISVRRVWDYEILNPDLVPRELCSPDHDKIKSAIDLGVFPPGIRAFQREIVTARGIK